MASSLLNYQGIQKPMYLGVSPLVRFRASASAPAPTTAAHRGSASTPRAMRTSGVGPSSIAPTRR